MRASMPIFAALVVSVLACDRKAIPGAKSSTAATGGTGPISVRGIVVPIDEYPLIGSRQLAPLTADSVDVTSVDSTGLGGVPLCAPLANVNVVFPHAVGMSVYCGEDGCDTPYPAKAALTRAGDTLWFESSPSSEETDRDRRPLVHNAFTSSRRLATGLGVRAGMSVGEILALGEIIDVPSYKAEVIHFDTGDTVTVRDGPSTLQLHLQRSGVVVEVRDADSVARYFTRRLVPGRPARETLDTAVRVDVIGVSRDRCG